VLVATFVGDRVPHVSLGQVHGVYREALHLRWEDRSWTVVLFGGAGEDYPWGVRVCGRRPDVSSVVVATVDREVLRVGSWCACLPRRSSMPQRPVGHIGYSRATEIFLRELLDGPRDRLSAVDRRVLDLHHPPHRSASLSGVGSLAPWRSVIGAGSGLTPFGDDLVVGTLAALRATGQACPDPIDLVDLQSMTTGPSAWLLHMGWNGVFGSKLWAMATAGARGDTADLAVRTERVTQMGGSSGTGWALGVASGLSMTLGASERS
jgi:hypothetical protein